MVTEPEQKSEPNHQVSQILVAASEHDNKLLQKYLNEFSFEDCAPVDVLDLVTGRCPLHHAVASCGVQNSQSSPSSPALVNTNVEEAGIETARLLLENGAIWNQLDKDGETPGCLARRLGLLDLYQLLVDAGVRAELLLNRLDGYEQLEDEEMHETEEELSQLVDSTGKGTSNIASDSEEKSNTQDSDVNSTSYLSSTLSFSKDKILDDRHNGVMMEWERGIMKRSAETIVDKPGLKVLNIGAGMLIFDSIVQGLDNKPSEHHIVEAHPDVLEDMRSKGWMEKENVTVHAGKWQEVLPTLVGQGLEFDSIYFDTFAESYKDFTDFFSENVVGLLAENGKWSFFNGMGADRQISYDVYQKVVEIDLYEAGFDVEWQDIDIPSLDKEWEGVKRKYWNIDKYRLPICAYI